MPCWDLPGQSKLETALWHLNFLLQDWVSPKLSVAAALSEGDASTWAGTNLL